MSVIPKLYLFKRNNGIYYVGWIEGSRRRWKSTACRTKPEALKQLGNFKEILKKRSAPKILSEFVHELLPYLDANYAAGTAKLYRTALVQLLSYAGDISLRALTPQHFDLYKPERLGRLSPVRSILN